MTAAKLAGWNSVENSGFLKDSRATMIMGGAIGAVIGGVAGHQAGQVAQKNALVEVRTVPVYEYQQIGWMPTERNASGIARDLSKGNGDYDIHYEELNDRHGTPPFQGQDPVRARVQVGEIQKEYRSSSLTPARGAAIGALTGGVLGVALGAATSTLARVIEA